MAKQEAGPAALVPETLSAPEPNTELIKLTDQPFRNHTLKGGSVLYSLSVLRKRYIKQLVSSWRQTLIMTQTITE